MGENFLDKVRGSEGRMKDVVELGAKLEDIEEGWEQKIDIQKIHMHFEWISKYVRLNSSHWLKLAQ